MRGKGKTQIFFHHRDRGVTQRKPFFVKGKSNCVNGERSTVNGRGGKARRLETGGRRREGKVGTGTGVKDLPKAQEPVSFAAVA